MSESYKNRDGAYVQQMFGKVAKRYDLTNGILSFQLHRLWNSALANTLSGETLLDLCAGTGEIAYRWLDRQHSPKRAILLDFCPEMLAIAKTKQDSYLSKGHTLQFIQADAAAIPLPDRSVDSVSVAYGVRNICDLSSCFSEVHRVLKPGGTFCILELTEPKNSLLKRLHGFYLNSLLPLLGGLLTQQKEAYGYLSKSIQQFIDPESLLGKLATLGFTKVECKHHLGGVATRLIVKK